MIEMMGKEIVVVQFRCKNWNAVPRTVEYVADWKEEGFREREARRTRNRNGGVIMIEDTDDVSLKEFVLEGFEITHVSYMMREGSYIIVRFVFTRRDRDIYRWDDDNDSSYRAEMLSAFKDMVTSSLWQVRGYVNPLYGNNEVVEKGSTISINCNSRVPLLQPDGSPVMRWRKEYGRRVGDAPIPIQPDHFLVVDDDRICIKPQ